MESREEIVRQEMRNLIAASCLFEKRPSKEFTAFHKNLLNFFFNSIDVNIDYENNLISIWNSKPLTMDPIRLYDLNEAISDRVGYNDLEETLIGCLEEGQLQYNFYKKLLFEYGDSIKDGDMLSA
ncbi:hypothetical protein A7A78_03470 [Aequorivita soesokkakensis]|uniref:Uncharacterized protein n=1 Tax=Aequorivita soesokkakensis TaxID=1385699 RepID=A0A1A9LE55_9FLAO|nr:hypothetical protein [Aequorivita soesokkakensis]OAD91558.1 hypothetical protein A7A78_03470 [Aequorivita soesokkakensis]